MAANLPEYVVAFHGVAWAGGTVTTLNPTFTASEVKHQLKDSGARLMITTTTSRDVARDAAYGTRVERIVVLDDSRGADTLASLYGEPQAAQTKIDTASHAVVMPYSSGTTGLPKGVMLSHDNLVVNVEQIVPMLGPEPGDNTIAFLPFFHIYGMTVLMNLYISSRASLVTMPRFDLEQFLSLVQRHRPRQLFVVPPVSLALAKHPLVDSYDLSSLKLIFSGAAPLGGQTTNAVRERLGCECIQGYGMTELFPVSHASGISRYRDGSVGQLVPSTRCRIVGDDGRDCGPNEEGEIWIQGPQSMLGYLNNPEATRKTISEDGWLRTGDLGCVDEDGFLFVRDRLKELIKVNGFAVAPAEIEACLNDNPAIADAAVIGIPDNESGERPMAFVVKAPEANVGEVDVMAHVAANLAHCKLLAKVNFVDAIPKSASGKILRRLLRDQVVQ